MIKRLGVKLKVSGLILIFSMIGCASYDHKSQLDFTQVSLERRGCHGPCASYLIKIFPDGKLNYKGYNYVKTKGEVEAFLTKKQLKEINNSIHKSDYSSFPIKTRCLTQGSDGESIVTEVTTRSYSHRINRSTRCGDWPQELIDFEKELQKIVDIEKFIGTEVERKTFVDHFYKWGPSH